MPAEKKAARASPTSGLRVIAFLAAALALIALGAFFWTTYRIEAGESSSQDRPLKSTLHLDTFVLNLADPAQRSYLRVGIDLGLGREAGRGQDAPPVAQVRDTILGVLDQARVDDLITPDGKTKLKADVLRALQERLPELKVKEVYFTEFLIQR
jgi:flagellar protein FliL